MKRSRWKIDFVEKVEHHSVNNSHAWQMHFLAKRGCSAKVITSLLYADGVLFRELWLGRWSLTMRKINGILGTIFSFTQLTFTIIITIKITIIKHFLQICQHSHTNSLVLLIQDDFHSPTFNFPRFPCCQHSFAPID